MAQNVTVPGLNSNFNTGVDSATITLTDQNGGYYPLGKIIDFHATPETSLIEVKAINLGGRILRKKNLNGWKGTITVSRENGALDALQAAEESRYLSGQPQMYYNIYQFVSNQDGTANEFQYVKAVVTLSDPGQWKLGAEVEMKLEFDCEQRVQLA
jgi:hypothetical protein